MTEQDERPEASQRRQQASNWLDYTGHAFLRISDREALIHDLVEFADFCERERQGRETTQLPHVFAKHLRDENTAAHLALDRLLAPTTTCVLNRAGDGKQDMTLGLSDRLAAVQSRIAALEQALKLWRDWMPFVWDVARGETDDAYRHNICAQFDALHQRAEQAEAVIARIKELPMFRPDAGPTCSNLLVPPTIATDCAFREVYSQGYRHALTDMRATVLRILAEETEKRHALTGASGDGTS